MSKRHKVIAAAGLLVFLAVCKADVVYGLNDSPSQNTAVLTIAADVSRKSIVLTYRFQYPLRDVRFHYKAQMIRERSWTVREPDLRLEDDSIRHAHGGPIQTLTIDVGLDANSTDFDRVYPSLRAVGELGMVFFTHYAMLDDVAFNEIRVSVSGANVVAYSNFVSARGVEGIVLPGASREYGRYLYFGDPELMESIASGLLAPDKQLPDWIVEQLREAIASAAAWLDAYFDSRNSDRLFVVATLDSKGENTRWRGDVVPNGEIFLRFHGKEWLEESAELGSAVQRFLAHELVHLENGSRFQAGEGEPEWLSEGLAEYLALIYTASSASSEEGEFLADEVTNLSSQCMLVLENKGIGISDPSIQREEYPYSCGVLAFWIADGASAPQRPGRELRAVWSSLVASIEGPGTAYGVHELLSALDANGKLAERDLLTTLIAGPEDDRWQNLDSMFSKLGVKVTHEQNDAWASLARTTLINHFLELQCESGRRGFWTYDDHIQLDTSEQCGLLSGNPRVDRVQGFSILNEMQDAFESVQDACLTRGTIEFALYESLEKLKVNCQRALPAVPPLVVLRKDQALLNDPISLNSDGPKSGEQISSTT